MEQVTSLACVVFHDNHHDNDDDSGSFNSDANSDSDCEEKERKGEKDNSAHLDAPLRLQQVINQWTHTRPSRSGSRHGPVSSASGASASASELFTSPTRRRNARPWLRPLTLSLRGLKLTLKEGQANMRAASKAGSQANFEGRKVRVSNEIYKGCEGSYEGSYGNCANGGSTNCGESHGGSYPDSSFRIIATVIDITETFQSPTPMAPLHDQLAQPVEANLDSETRRRQGKQV